MNPLQHSLCSLHPWLLVRVWRFLDGRVHLRAGGYDGGAEWRLALEGERLEPLLEELSGHHDPRRTRIRLSLDQAALLEQAQPGSLCHNLVGGGRRRLVPGGKAEPVRAGAVLQGTLGVNRLLGDARWLKLQQDTPAERERRLGRDLDAFADAADYLWEHGWLRLARPAGMVNLAPGWIPEGPSPLVSAIRQAVVDGEQVRVQLCPRRVDPEKRHSECARITGLEDNRIQSSLGEYPLEAVYGLDRDGAC